MKFYPRIFLEILIVITVICLGLTYLRKTTRLKDLQKADDLIESIKEANISTNHDFSIIMTDYYDNVPVYRITIQDGIIHLYDNDKLIEFNLEIILNVLENLPHFAGKYSKFLMEKTKNNLDSSNTILKALENGKSENKHNNKTNK